MRAISLTAVSLFSLLALGAATGCTASSSEDPATSDEELRAKKTLLCASATGQPVYYARESQILLEANVSRDGVLANMALSMPDAPDLGNRNETISAQKKYEPTNPRYKGMQKYSSADAWCGYSIIAPPDLNGQTGKFSVYLQQACEAGGVSTATLSCKVEARKPAGPDAPPTGAAIELRFSAARKAEVIQLGYYEASAFTGNTIVVGTPTTDLDFDRLRTDDDIESAPDTLCYSGDTSKAKTILRTMVGNTDGNGDHFLEGAPRYEGTSAKTITVKYTVVGEGGPQDRVVPVPLCQ